MPDYIRFPTAGLLSKWGFGDGDMLEDVLDEWLDGKWPDEDFAADALGFEHRVLVRVVREHVLPHVTTPVEVYELGTIHNPIRAKTVNGGPWDDYTTDVDGWLEPEYVDVPLSEVLSIAADERGDS
jgi:hypothetical protein